MTDVPTFDLTHEPWIRVRAADGSVAELSLRDVFDRADTIVRLAGDLPTQDVAVLRLLLAILRRSHPKVTTPADWSARWQGGSFDTGPIDDYLTAHRDRFDLLHPSTPFYQVAGLRTAKGEMTNLSRLVADVPPGHAYFTTRTGAGLSSMSFAEAARWIVHCQAFDPSGIKSGALGDERVKGGKGYPIGVAWCGWLGLVVLEGSSLFETLMLNLTLGGRIPAEPDLPVWERAPQGPASEARAAPRGPVDLLTWQSRRIRLGHDGRHATAVLIANGDALHPRNRFGEELMSSWRRSQAQEKALGSADPVYMPRAHAPERALWRGLAGLLAEDQAGASGVASKPGQWLEWLAELRSKRVLPRDLPVHMRAVGMQYGSQSSVTDDITDDVLVMSGDVLSDRRLRVLAVSAVRTADVGVRVLATLGGELAEAAGADAGPARSTAYERGYAALDAPYRQWVAGLTSGSDQDDERTTWQRQVRAVLTEVARELVRNAGQAAWAGREVRRGPDRTLYLDAAIAELGFQRGLAAALPLASRTTKETIG